MRILDSDEDGVATPKDLQRLAYENGEALTIQECEAMMDNSKKWTEDQIQEMLS